MFADALAPTRQQCRLDQRTLALRRDDNTNDQPTLVRPPLLCGIALAGRRFKKTYELFDLSALKFSPVNKMPSCNAWVSMGGISKGTFEIHTKCLTHTLKDTNFMER